jgi:starch synthase
MKENSPMRVLAAIVIPPHLIVSGAVNAAKALSQSVAAYCTVDIALMSNCERQTTLGKAVLLERKAVNPFNFTKSVLPDKFRTLFYRSDIPNLVLSGNYDLVHLHNAIPTIEMKRIAKACVDCGVPYIISTHGFVEITDKDQAYNLKIYEKIAGKIFIDRPLNYVVRHATKVFAGSPYELPLLTKLAIPTTKISLITNGVNEYFLQSPSSEQMDRVIRRFGLPPDEQSRPVTYFYLGNHTQNKGLPVLLDTLMQITEPYLMIVGGKKRNTIDYERYCALCQPGQRIIFTDLLLDEDILALSYYADLFVFPTLADTLPLVILDAMACGLPILSTQIGGIPYQVSSECGYLVTPGDSNALGEAIRYLSQNKQLLESMGKAARNRVETLFRWEEIARTAFAEYSSIFSDNTTPTKITSNS